MSDLRRLLEAQENLPALPSLEDLKAAHQERLELAVAIIAAAEELKDQSEAFLSALDGKKRSPARSRGKAHSHQVLESTYLTSLEALGTHDYAGRITIAQDTGLSVGHAGSAMNEAVRRGHALRSTVKRRHRYEITEAGREFVNAPNGQRALVAV